MIGAAHIRAVYWQSGVSCKIENAGVVGIISDRREWC